MSTGNDNFITVDSIAEIQDITDGDFLFSISNGVIYKLDFSNFIITLDNTDFGTNYRALSTQVTINTAVLSALGFLGGEQFNIIDQLIDAYEVVSELSAAWTASYNSVFNLSSTRWLPVPSVDEPFQSGLGTVMLQRQRWSLVPWAWFTAGGRSPSRRGTLPRWAPKRRLQQQPRRMPPKPKNRPLPRIRVQQKALSRCGRGLSCSRVSVVSRSGLDRD